MDLQVSYCFHNITKMLFAFVTLILLCDTMAFPESFMCGDISALTANGICVCMCVRARVRACTCVLNVFDTSVNINRYNPHKL